jgi:hypothetical protein
MGNQIKRALDLVKKTGDRLIIFEGPESDKAFVIMDFEQYEALAEWAEEGHCDCEDDCDCGQDDDDTAFENYDDEPIPVSENDYAAELKSLTEEELLDKINRDIALWKESQVESDVQNETAESAEDLNFKSENSFEEKEKNRGRWAIKSQIKDNADEIIEEDRHYLEEVKY